MRARCRWLCRCSLAVFVLWLLQGPALADSLRLVLEVDDEDAAGAPFPPGAGIQLELADDAGVVLDWKKGRRAFDDAANLSFERDASGTQRVHALDPATGELLVLHASERSIVSETRRLRELVGVAARGLAVDAASDRLYVLEGERGRILRVDGFARGARRQLSEIALPANAPALAGLAFDPASSHLLALAPASGELLELAGDGTLLAVKQLPARVQGARAIAIAPSLDTTDEPERNSLFVAAASESGGSTFELAVEPLALAVAATIVPTLVQTVNMANFTPPSPDPSGVELLASNGPLLVSDAEVEEMAIFSGVNLYDVALTGNLSGTSSTTFFSDEPTGVARNPANGHLFFSDDTGTRSVYEVTPGADNRVNPGDPVRQIVFSSSIDTEGVAFGAGSLWIADGVNAEVRRVSPGPNGIFENGGDDVLANFDTAGFGLTDPEGIAFDTDGGHLYLVGEPENRVAHVTTDGTLLRWLDTSAANPDVPAGLAYGPGPPGSPTRRLYIVARGVDNGGNPNENDGKLFVFAVDPLGGGGTNQAPSVSAGPDLALDLAASAFLDGTVSDDGLPSGTLSSSWSAVSGPGTVGFANANAVDTTATFSSVGSYVLRLTASDGELSSFDDVAVNVTSSGGATTLERRVLAGADDAEQGASGSVSLGSSDLELVTDGSDVQSVGIRFSGLAIPAGAAIQSAWIQFQADEASSAAATLTLEGEASDNAAPFTSGANNVGARPRTAASVVWTPPAWNVVGEAGAAQRTPDLAAVVQQIVSRSGWASGNALAFVITGNGRRVAESFEGTAAGAALLHVVFGAGSGNLAPSASAGPDQIVLLGQAAALDGSASDDGQPSGTLTTTWSRVSGPGSVGFGDASAVDTSATFSAAGGYVLRLAAFDGELSGQDEMAVSVIDPNAAGVVERRISAGSDDAEQRISNGAVSVTGSDLELAVDGTRAQWIGLRFPDLSIPPGVTIQNAWIQLMADEVGIAPVSLTIQGEASANATGFTATSNNVGARPRTGAAVAWAPDVWNSVGEAGAAQRTPNLTSVVQEIVNQPGWSPGNAMAFILGGSGTRTAESLEGKPAGAALLHVEYAP